MADGHANRLNVDTATGTPEYPAQAERLFALTALAPGTSALTARGGRRLGPGLELTVAADGTTFTVQPGVCVVPGGNATSGPYVVVIPTPITKSVPAKPASGLQRRDLIVVEVYDEDIAEKATALRESQVRLVQGTAASSPAAPALPVMAMEVGQLNSTSTTTTVYSQNLTYTWAPGGVGVVPNWGSIDTLPGAYDGLIVYSEVHDAFKRRVRGRFLDDAATDYSWGPALTMGSGWTNIGCVIRKVGPKVHLDLQVNRSGSDVTTSYKTPGNLIATLPSNYLPEVATPSNGIYTVGIVDQGTAHGQAFIQINDMGEVRLRSNSITVRGASGDSVYAQAEWFSYYAAM